MARTLLAAVAVAAFAAAAPFSSGWAQPGPAGPPLNPDKDRDGKVTLSEFKAVQDDRQVRMFNRLDANKDGQINKAEMDAAAKRAQSAGRGPPAGGPGRGGGFLLRMDANNDGAVTRAELGAMTERRFKTADTNHDGWLSRGEMLMMQQRMRGGPGSS